MIAFTSFPKPKNSFSHAPPRLSAINEDDIEFDMYEEDDGEDFDSGTKSTCPGESVASSHAYMRGHGTFIDQETVISSVAGTIERVGKLVSVRGTRTRYNPEVGGLIVGRIAEVQPRRWKVDANSRQDAVLMLSSIKLPGGVQRRKLESDELQMRRFFEEGDILVAEVQTFFADGAMSLHTRSLMYSKLRDGQFVCVPPTLIRWLKSHFVSLPCNVDLILGLNGYIWVNKRIDQTRQPGKEGLDAESVYSNQNEAIDAPARMAVSRVTNLTEVLASHFVPLSDAILLEAYEWAVENDVEVRDLTQPDVCEALTATVDAKG